jgi:hypothetical protein
MEADMKARNISLLMAVIVPMALSCSTSSPGDKVQETCSISPESYNFGNVVLGEYADLTVTIKAINNVMPHIEGTARIDCQGFAFYLPGSSDPVDSFEFYLDFPEERIFTIRFEPLVEGTYDCTVEFGTSCGTMALVGAGIESADEGWEQMPQVTDNDLYDICMDQYGFGLAVGDSGTVLIKHISYQDFAVWGSYDFGHTRLNAVWKDAGSIFYAAGGEISADPGWIFKFDTQWGILDQDYMMEYYTSIWGSDECDIYFGGVNVVSMGENNLKRYDCDAFTTFELSMSMFAVSGISGSSSSDVWAVLRKPGPDHVYHFNGTAWSVVEETWMSETLEDVWVSAGGEVFAVGSNAAIYYYDGAEWGQGMVGGFGGNFYGVWGTAADDVYAVGTGAAIYHYDGNEWTRHYAPPGVTQDLYSVWGSGSSDVWAVGQDGLILHHD